MLETKGFLLFCEINVDIWYYKVPYFLAASVCRGYRIKGDGSAYPGWKICDSSYQNKGYGPKIIKMLFEYIFTVSGINFKLPIDSTVWDTMLENKRAQHVYESKIGAKKIGIQENVWKDQLGNWQSTVYYEITREDFFKLQNDDN